MPREEACYHLYHSGVVDNTGRRGVAIAFPTPTMTPCYKGLQRRTHPEANRPHASAVPLGLFRYRLSGFQAGAQKGSEHGSAMLDTAELKVVALEHLLLDLRNLFEG